MKNILIIDDDDIFRYSVCQFLRRNNFHVITAENALMGLDLAKEQYPDLIICNLDMPSLKRDDILEKLREYPETALVPLILLTGDNTISSRRLSQNLGGNISLLKKSLRLSEILDAILIKIVDEPIPKTIGD